MLEGVVGCPRGGERNAEWLKAGQVSDLKPCDSTCLYNFSEEPFLTNAEPFYAEILKLVILTSSSRP